MSDHPNNDSPTSLSFQIVGDAFVDMLCFLQSSWPERGGDAYLSQAISTAAGGSAVNTATHLTHLCRELDHLKGSNVVLHTVLNPSDHFGMLQQDHAASIGYRLVNCLHAPPAEAGATGHCLVVVAEGERSFMSYRGCMQDFQASHVDFTAIAQTESDVHLHVAGFYNLHGFFDQALQTQLQHFLALRKEPRYSQFQTFVSLVPQHDATGEWDGGIRDLIPLLDIFILNQLEATAISGIQGTMDETDPHLADRFAAWFSSTSPNTCVVITLGPRGAVACRNGVVFASVSAPNVDPIDPTGAGDNFAAGFLHGLWSWKHTHSHTKIDVWPDEAIRAAIRWGCAVGTASVLVRGASVPSQPDAIFEMYDQTLFPNE